MADTRPARFLGLGAVEIGARAAVDKRAVFNAPWLHRALKHQTARKQAFSPIHGQLADWDAAARLAARYPIFLAGGLNPGNVVAAVAQVKPWGVDVASGVEVAPGQKDHLKIREFVAAASAA